MLTCVWAFCEGPPLADVNVALSVALTGLLPRRSLRPAAVSFSDTAAWPGLPATFVPAAMTSALALCFLLLVARAGAMSVNLTLPGVRNVKPTGSAPFLASFAPSTDLRSFEACFSDCFNPATSCALVGGAGAGAGAGGAGGAGQAPTARATLENTLTSSTIRSVPTYATSPAASGEARLAA